MYSLNLVDTIFSQKEIIRNNNERCESQANKQRHLVFKGISLNNNINTFVSLLESKGFNVIYRSPNYNQVRMSGDVGYYRNCDITIFYTSISNVISTLWVHTKKNELESMRLEEFKKCIAILKEKYGDPFYEDGKLCYFRSNGGTISLECDNILNCITFHYFDYINSYLSEEEDKQTLLSDI